MLLKPGYYLALGPTILHSPDGPYKIRVYREDWLVTNGTVVGRFDKEKALDWLPLEWRPGHMMVLDEGIAKEIWDVVIETTYPRLEERFKRLVRVDEDDESEVIPDMPRPSLRDGLGTYLKVRRQMFASERVATPVLLYGDRVKYVALHPQTGLRHGWEGVVIGGKKVDGELLIEVDFAKANVEAFVPVSDLKKIGNWDDWKKEQRHPL
jgi:hypothetical protein